MALAYQYRIKDATTARHLERQARGVNRVWNDCGEVQHAARCHNRRRPSAFDLIRLTCGSSKLPGLRSDTVQAACAIRVDGDVAIVLGRRYRRWLSRRLEGRMRCGCFAEDARGRWYLNLQAEFAQDSACGTGEAGIDRGLASLASLSTGEKVEAPHRYHQYEQALGVAQRAAGKPRVRAIHAKIANCRRHFLHEVCSRLVRENGRIGVGNVNAQGLARTALAKSVLDAGWSQLRSQPRYKAIRHGAGSIEVDE